MKMIHKITVGLLLVMMAAGCANDVTDPMGGDAASRSVYRRLASWENVKLTWATLRWSESGTAFKIQPTGAILLRNLSYVKDVAIRYTTNGWKSWSEIKAQYSSNAEDNCEYWAFNGSQYTFVKSFPTQSLTDAVKINFDFVVRFKVNGVTYWDNNGSKNYHMDQVVRYISN